MVNVKVLWMKTDIFHIVDVYGCTIVYVNIPYNVKYMKIYMMINVIYKDNQNM